MPVLARARRCITLLVAALVLGVTPAASAAPPSGGAGAAGLTAGQQRIVLGLIDDICGDTWCEGDYLFDFRGFSCDRAERTCTLRLRIARLADEPQWYVRSGRVRGFTRFSQMVDTAANGYRSLDWDFYLAVSDLIGRIERRVPAAPGR